MKYTEFNPRSFEVHDLVLRKIQINSRVLDLGCATGYFSHELKKKECFVYGLDYEKKALDIAKNVCDKTLLCDFERIKTVTLNTQKFDYILLMDVIEHLRNREDILKFIQKWLKPDGTLLLSTPNIAHISIRWNLLLGNFDYTNLGILDETHVRFFTKKSLTNLLIENGFKLTSLEGAADFGQIPFIGRFMKHIPKKIQYTITQFFPTALSVQMVVEAQIKK